MADKRISAKKALESAEIIAQYCKEQRACQNCIFRQFGAEAWKCHIQAFELRDVLLNIERKKETAVIYKRGRKNDTKRGNADFGNT